MHAFAPALAALAIVLVTPAHAEIRWATDARSDGAGTIVYSAFSADPSLDYLLIYGCSPAEDGTPPETLLLQTPRLWLPDDVPAPVPMGARIGDTVAPMPAFTSGDYQGFFTATASRGGQPEAFDAFVRAIANASAPFTLSFDGHDFAYPAGANTAIDMTRASCGLD